MKIRKAGTEDIILMLIPADRFFNHIPARNAPPVDNRSRYQIVLLVQSCERNSYGCHEAAGPMIIL
jgi:hypothetical protein